MMAVLINVNGKSDGFAYIQATSEGDPATRTAQDNHGNDE